MQTMLILQCVFDIHLKCVIFSSLIFTTIGGNDYTNPIPSGATITLRSTRPSVELTLTANSDNLVEGNETFRLDLELASGSLSSGQFLQSPLNVVIMDTTGGIR